MTICEKIIVPYILVGVFAKTFLIIRRTLWTGLNLAEG
jgi:hypothetical protein